MPPCTARTGWGALGQRLGYASRPDDMPVTLRCVHERGHAQQGVPMHRAVWREHAHEWEPIMGGVREGAGRPPLEPDAARTERVVVRLRLDELRAMERAAGGEGVGPWLRGLGMRAAKLTPPRRSRR